MHNNPEKSHSCWLPLAPRKLRWNLNNWLYKHLDAPFWRICPSCRHFWPRQLDRGNPVKGNQGEGDTKFNLNAHPCEQRDEAEEYDRACVPPLPLLKIHFLQPFCARVGPPICQIAKGNEVEERKDAYRKESVRAIPITNQRHQCHLEECIDAFWRWPFYRTCSQCQLRRQQKGRQEVLQLQRIDTHLRRHWRCSDLSPDNRWLHNQDQ